MAWFSEQILPDGVVRRCRAGTLKVGVVVKGGIHDVLGFFVKEKEARICVLPVPSQDSY